MQSYTQMLRTKPACSTRRNGSPSFTLIEIMVVVAIIAILAGLLFPVVLGALERYRVKHALTDTHRIVIAIKAYRAEYGKWPGQIQAVEDMSYMTSNFIVIQALTTSSNNPKRIQFLPIQTKWLDDLGNFVNPWGVPYLIGMDESDDGDMSFNFSGFYSNQFTGTTGTYSYITTVNGMKVGVVSFGSVTNTSWDMLFGF